MSGVVSLRTGLPANVVRNGNLPGYEGLRPNVLGDPNLDPADRSVSRYFSTKVFSVAGLGQTQPGNAGRNIVRGPGLINLDLRLLRSIPVQGELQVDLGFEAFNATNSPHFANPNTDMSSGAFGTITQTTGNPRLLQFSARLRF